MSDRPLFILMKEKDNKEVFEKVAIPTGMAKSMKFMI